MSPGQKKREHLIRLYSQNLQLYYSDVPPTFVCPLCCTAFPLAELHENSGLVSLAHITPKSLRGTMTTLTCTQCNNTMGRNIDSHLSMEKQWLDWQNGQVEMAGRMIAGRANLGAKLRRRTGGWHFTIIDGQTKPGAEEVVKAYLANTPEYEIHFQVRRYNPLLRNAGFLHSAFLTLFYNFGYEYALCQNAHRIRSALRSPGRHKGLLNNAVFTLAPETATRLPASPAVVQIVLPVRLRTLLICFPWAGHSSAKVAVVMPGFEGADWASFRNILRQQKQGLKVTFRCISIPDEARLTDTKRVFGGHRAWARACASCA